ncbi:MAG: hypothetical protein JW748_06680 [Anaerolineales bacterium]|nr:hypothetical protein [Anaerolineales bacterium]
MEKQIESAVKRGRAYWFADGFTEIAGGIFFLLLGGVVLLRGFSGQNVALSQFASTAVDIGAIKLVTLLMAGLVIWWLKDRFTYPRTGFVEGKRVILGAILNFIRNVVLIAVIPLLGLIAALIFIPSMRTILATMPAWFPMGIGSFLGILCSASGEWMGLRRFRVMGLLILLTGLAVGIWQITIGFPTLSVEALQANWLAPMPEALRAPLDEILSRFFTGVGGLTLAAGFFFLVSGLVTFLRYRRENPAPYREEA